MTPEPLPLDREDFVFKDRKHERGHGFDSLPPSGGGNYNHRWREQRDQYYPPRRPPHGYHRQHVSYHQMYDEPPSRWRHGGRGGRGPFRRSPYRDMPPHVTSQRSLAVPLPFHSPRPDRDRDRDRDRENLRWKPMKWAQRSPEEHPAPRPRSLERESLVRPSVEPPVPVEEEVPKKKPRLGWGQGLAKYERQKVEGSTNSGKDQVSETSPKITGMAGSASPITPCSAPIPSSGMEQRPFSKVATMVSDTFHVDESPAIDPKSYQEELSINTDNLPPISMLASLLNDLFQSQDAFCGDSTFTRNTPMNKLLCFKADIAKELEKAECEIDLFENELKVLTATEKSVPSQRSSALQDGGNLKTSLDSSSGLSSALRGTEDPVLQTCSVNKYGTPAKKASDSTSPLVISSISRSNMHQPLDDLGRVVGENVNNEDRRLDPSSSSTSYYTVDASSRGISEENLIASIMASNKNAADQAAHAFDKVLPNISQHFDMWCSDQILLCRKNDQYVKEQIALHKHQESFKDRVLALKFRALHHLWKEDLRLITVRKQQPKSQKRSELPSRSSQGGQKHRSSTRSRLILNDGNSKLVPTAEIIDFARKLSDSDIKQFRSNLKMPALILDEKERRFSMFKTENALVEDPVALEKERAMINPWTQEEIRIFREMLATYGKDFTKISSFLRHKNTADCIGFYYKNHKSESFRDVKKKLDSRKQSRRLASNTFMITTGKKWSSQANASSLNKSRAASGNAATESGPTKKQRKFAAKPFLPRYRNSHASSRPLDTVNRSKVSRFDKEIAAADVLTGMCGAISSEAISSCVTNSVPLPEKSSFGMIEQPLTPAVTRFEDDDSCSDEGCELSGSIDWTDEEKSTLVRALSLYGKDFAKISQCIRTKSRDQCKIFYSKARKVLGLDMIQPAADNVEAPGGRSEPDDTCPELDSAICNTQPYSKMDVDPTQSVKALVHAGNTSLQAEAEQSSQQHEQILSSEPLGSKAESEQEAENLEAPKTSDETANDNPVGCSTGEPAGGAPPDVGKSKADLQKPESRWGDMQHEKIVTEDSHAKTAGVAFTTMQSQERDPLNLISRMQMESPFTSSRQDPTNSIIPSTSTVPPRSLSYAENFLQVTCPSSLYFGEQAKRRVEKATTALYFHHQSVNTPGNILSGYPIHYLPDMSNKNQENSEQANQIKLFGQIVTNPSPLQKSSSLPLDFPQPKISLAASRPRSSGQDRSYGFSSLPIYSANRNNNVLLPYSSDYPEFYDRDFFETVTGRKTVSDPVAAILAATTERAAVESRRPDLGGGS